MFVQCEQMVSSYALDAMMMDSVTCQKFGTSLAGHCHTCAARRGQMVSLSALETTFMGRVESGDHEENGEC